MQTRTRADFDQRYQTHLKHLKLKGLQPKTIDAYARAIRRMGEYFNHKIDALSAVRSFYGWSCSMYCPRGLDGHATLACLALQQQAADRIAQVVGVQAPHRRANPIARTICHAACAVAVRLLRRTNACRAQANFALP